MVQNAQSLEAVKRENTLETSILPVNIQFLPTAQYEVETCRKQVKFNMRRIKLEYTNKSIF